MDTILKPFSAELRGYQSRDISLIEEALVEHKTVLYQLPTGGGKSVVISKIIYDLYGQKRFLVFAHKKKLLSQLLTRFRSLGMSVGYLQGMNEENLSADVIVCSIRTAAKSKRLTTLLEQHWDYVIVDEARHTRTTSYDIVLDSLKDHLPQLKMLGVDATPYRRDGKSLDKHFKHLIASDSISSLIEQGFLAPFTTFSTPIDGIKEEVKLQGGDYQTSSLSEFMRKPAVMNYCLSLYKNKGEGKQTIVFCVDKAHAKALRDVFEKEYPEKTAYIDSDCSDDEIELAYLNYECNESQFLFNVEMATEGVDLPDTGCILGARPTMSLTLYMQMVGRGTRLKSDNSKLIVLDACGWTESFGSISAPKTWSLDPTVDPANPSKGRKIVARKADGTLSEDIQPFDELVDVSAEEFFEQALGGKEAAQAHNLSLEEKIETIKAGLIPLILEHLAKVSKYEFTIPETHRLAIVKNSDDICLGHVSSDYTLLKLSPHKSGSEYYVSELQTPNSWSSHRYSEGLPFAYQFAGLFTTALKFTKLNEKLIAHYTKIKEYEKQKIDMDRFKAAENAAKEANMTNLVLDLIASGHEFEFGSGFSYFDLFPQDQYKKTSGHGSWVYKLTLQNKSFTDGFNTVTFFFGRDCSAQVTRRVKGDKLMNLLKNQATLSKPVTT